MRIVIFRKYLPGKLGRAHTDDPDRPPKSPFSRDPHGHSVQRTATDNPRATPAHEHRPARKLTCNIHEHLAALGPTPNVLEVVAPEAQYHNSHLYHTDTACVGSASYQRFPIGWIVSVASTAFVDALHAHFACPLTG